MSIKLSSGHEMPLVGFGCFRIPENEAADAVYNAIKAGYRLIDGAMDYGNEKGVGEGLKRAFADGLVKREDLFITSKLWNNFHHPKNVPLALNKVLEDLGLEYIDLFLIHFPIAQRFVPIEERYPPNFYCGDGDKWHYEDVTHLQTWHAMEELTKGGKVKSIGISNFNASLILDLLKGANIQPSVLQIEHNPYLQQKQLVEFVQKNNIAITAYWSFGTPEIKEKSPQSQELLEHDLIKKIADKNGKTTHQVLLRWATQRNIAVIPKTVTESRLAGNLNFNDFEITEEELAEIEKLDLGLRFNDPWGWDKIPIFY